MTNASSIPDDVVFHLQQIGIAATTALVGRPGGSCIDPFPMSRRW
jgi:hypothetical protein